MEGMRSGRGALRNAGAVGGRARAVVSDGASPLCCVSRLLLNVWRFEPRLGPAAYRLIGEDVEYAVPAVIAANLQGAFLTQRVGE